jgi:uncharacterized repeat protein (TIGR03943 family)
VTEDRDRSVLLLLTGAFAVWLAWSGVVLNFVRPSMRPYVLVAGIVTVLLALLPPGGLLTRLRTSHGHGHAHPDGGIAWLLVVPLLVVIVVPPAPLGANAIRARLVSSRAGSRAFPPVGRPVRGAVPMTMAEFQTRALRDPARSMEGVTVRLVGFVAGPADAGGYRVARFVIFCCAADAEAVEIVVANDSTARPTNAWLEIEGTWVPGPLPTVRASSVHPIKRPGKPYEYTVVWSG